MLSVGCRPTSSPVAVTLTPPPNAPSPSSFPPTCGNVHEGNHAHRHTQRVRFDGSTTTCEARRRSPTTEPPRPVSDRTTVWTGALAWSQRAGTGRNAPQPPARPPIDDRCRVAGRGIGTQYTISRPSTSTRTHSAWKTLWTVGSKQAPGASTDASNDTPTALNRGSDACAWPAHSSKATHKPCPRIIHTPFHEHPIGKGPGNLTRSVGRLTLKALVGSEVVHARSCPHDRWRTPFRLRFVGNLRTRGATRSVRSTPAELQQTMTDLKSKCKRLVWSRDLPATRATPRPRTPQQPPSAQTGTRRPVDL